MGGLVSLFGTAYITINEICRHFVEVGADMGSARLSQCQYVGYTVIKRKN